MAGELEGDLLQVAGREHVFAGPCEDGLDEALVRFAIEREPGFDQAVGVVQDRVGAGVHGGTRCWGVFARVADGHRWVSSLPSAPSSSEQEQLVIEVRDAGRLTDPLAGRRPLERGQVGGRGLLLVHYVSDLVRVHTGDDDTTVRFYLSL